VILTFSARKSGVILLSQTAAEISESVFPFHQKANRVRSCSSDELLPSLLEAMREEPVNFKPPPTPFPWKWVLLGLVLALAVGFLQLQGGEAHGQGSQTTPVLIQQEKVEESLEGQGVVLPDLEVEEGLTLEEMQEEEAVRLLEEELKRKREALNGGKKRAAGGQK